MSGLVGPFLRAMENTLQFWRLPPIAMFGWRKTFERANYRKRPVIRKNSIRTQHLCNQQLPNQERSCDIQNVTVLHRAEKAPARSFAEHRSPRVGTSDADLNLLHHHVELLGKLELQVVDVPIACIKVPKFFQLLLEREKRIEILLGQAFNVDRCILKESENPGSARVLERAERNVELFFGELARLGEEQANEDITIADSLVVLILQASFRHGINEVFRANHLQINPFFRQLIVIRAEVQIESVPVLSQL